MKSTKIIVGSMYIREEHQSRVCIYQKPDVNSRHTAEQPKQSLQIVKSGLTFIYVLSLPSSI